jgi:hypothetical protein
MPKQPVEPKKPALAQPDRVTRQVRKEAAQRVEELKLRLIVLAERHFEQSLRIIKRWVQDGAKDDAQKKR